MLSGSALCVVNLYKIAGVDGDYEWHLTDVRKVKPFPVKGKLNLYEVDDALIHFPGEKIEKQEAAPVSPQPAAIPAMPQIPGMPKMIDNVNIRVKDDLEKFLRKFSLT